MIQAPTKNEFEQFEVGKTSKFADTDGINIIRNPIQRNLIT